MRLLYNAGIQVYQFLIWVVSFRNPKAKKWLSGRKNLFERLQTELVPGKGLLWFHVSSLGEFEQARPVIEGVKKHFPGYRILLTFFSPSGYELRKDYPLADYVCYLPLDTPRNAKKFLDIVKPDKVFFVKYEFWFNFLTELKKREIPTYLFSALFRPSQFFFKPWGKWFRKAFSAYTHIFVQNKIPGTSCINSNLKMSPSMEIPDLIGSRRSQWLQPICQNWRNFAAPSRSSWPVVPGQKTKHFF